MLLNESALAIAADMIARAPHLAVTPRFTECGTRVIDCGVQAPGSDEAGIELARIAMAGRGSVRLDPPGATASFGGVTDAATWKVPTVAVTSDDPVTACLASQYAGWKVSHGSFFAMASGPIRAAIGREDLFEELERSMHRDLRERSEAAVGLLEASKIPPDEVCRKLAADAGVSPERLLLLVSRTASPAGTLQVIARSLETALHKLETLHFDLSRIRRGSGRAPLAPVANDDLAAIGRTNDAILYGGEVVLEVTGDDESLLAVGPRAVSGSSPAFGEPFSRLFEKAGGDFYAIDPALFAPALIEFHNIDTGRRQRFGRIAPKIVDGSFGVDASGASGAGRT